MESRGYTNQSATDPYFFIGQPSIFLVYVDDGIIFSRKNSGISHRLIQSIKDNKNNFELTDKGDLKRYLGVDITKRKDGIMEFT